MNTALHEAERSFALDVVQRLRDAGFEALWAGGCVRDLLRGEEPSDYDVATSATPHQVRELFGRRKTIPVGVAFGVVIVMGPRRAAGQVEVATFRTDASYSDGRRPDSVQFSTAEEDALRRDFTINGMFYDPIAEQVIDFVGGQDDLKAGIVRAIGNAQDRIAEDKLRMLRAIRFAARFSFALDEATREAIREAAPDVTVVSGERIAVELEKTLATRQASWALAEWEKLGLMHAILPEFSTRWRQLEDDVIALVTALDKASWHVKLSGLLLVLVESKDWSKTIETLKAKLKWSNASTEAIRFTLESQQILDEARALPWSVLQPVLTDENIGSATTLLNARHKLRGHTQTYNWLKERLQRPQEELDPAPLLLGSDLLQMGLRPGPQFKSLLDEVRRQQLDGELANQQAAIAWVKANASSDP